MEKKYFRKLLTKYTAGKTSPEEETFLRAYYNLFENEPDVIAMLTEEQRLFLQEEIKGDIWKSINSKEHELSRGKIRPLWLKRLSAAAVFTLICSVTILLWADISWPSGTDMVVVGNKDKAGQTIKLADGSTVILGADSRIEYAGSFNNTNKREVYLVGNAFFDVAHDSSRPFIVHSDKVETVVLGTAFTIEAYPWAREITVTVKRGKVKVSDEKQLQGIITPNQQIRYNKGKRVSVQKKVNAAQYSDWKAGSLLFDNVTLAEATDIIEKKFKIRVVVADKVVGAKRFTASFNVTDPPEVILKSICEFNEVPYSYDKGKALAEIGAR